MNNTPMLLNYKAGMHCILKIKLALVHQYGVKVAFAMFIQHASRSKLDGAKLVL